MMIYNNNNKISTLFLILLFALSLCPVSAYQSGHLEYDGLNIDYSRINVIQVEQQANLFFNQAQSSVIKEEKEAYIDAAMRNYYLLTKIKTEDIFPFVQLARIYDEKNKNRLAKEYFFKATNIDVNNPYANYYFGEFYFKRRDYKRALTYYNNAYNNGFNNRYDLNLRLGTIYEKFADLANAKRFYTVTYSMKPDDIELQQKINSLNELNYEKSEYYHFIRE